MATATKPSRGWEKSSGTQPRTAQSPLAQLTSFVDGLTDVERASHRAAYLQLLASMTGTNITVNLVDGKKLTGVLNTATPFEGKPHVVAVKAGRLLQGDNSPTSNGANDGKTAVVSFDSVTTIESNSKVELVSKNYTSEFQTDAAIKKHGDMSHLAGRNLQSVDSSWLEASGDMSLDAKGGKNWDQFEVNKRLFNVKDTYDENLYTKKLDLKNTSAAQIAQAERLAREIESQTSGNIHLQEERGQVTQGDWDEEDRFSGVLREEERGAGGKKAPTKPVEAGGAWTRGVRLGAGSGAPSPATVAAAAGGTGQQSGSSSKPGSKPLTPPPGVAMPAAGQATNQASPKKAAQAGSQASSSAPSPATVPASAAALAAASAEASTGDKKAPTAEGVASGKASPKNAPTTEKPTEGAQGQAPESAPAATAPAAETTTAPTKPAAPAAVPKLRADAAEFKPSWMKDPAPPAAAPSTPSQPPMVHPSVNQFTPPPMYANVPYGVVPQMTPEGGMPQYMHGSPAPQGMVVGSPNMGGMPGPDMPPGQPYYEQMPMVLPPGPQGFDPYSGAPQPFIYAPGPGPAGQMPPMGMPMQMGAMQGMPVDFNPAMMTMPGHPVMMPYAQGPPPNGMDYYGNAPPMMMGGGQPMMAPFPGGAPMYAPTMPGNPGMYPPHAMGGPGNYMSPNGNMGGQKMGGMRNTPNSKGGRGPGSGMKGPGGPYGTPNRGMSSGPNTPHTGAPQHQQHQQTRTSDSAAEAGGP